jgi:hypothetical protein
VPIGLMYLFSAKALTGVLAALEAHLVAHSKPGQPLALSVVEMELGSHW